MSCKIKYLGYLLRHKWYVGIECFKRGLYWRGIKHDWSKFLPSEFVPYANYFYGQPKIGDTIQCSFDNTGCDGTVIKTRENRLVGGSSRFDTDCFIRDKHGQEFWVMFYEIDKILSAPKQPFDIAWNHHQKRNPHHWQYWVLMNDNGSVEAMPMPFEDKVEMLCDWMGAGAAIKRKAPSKAETKAWFDKNRANMKLHSSTIEWLENEL